jgi:hypothetical protein
MKPKRANQWFWEGLGYLLLGVLLALWVGEVDGANGTHGGEQQTANPSYEYNRLVMVP